MPEVHVDDEAVLWSASAADREGRPLLLLLHGYNSNEGDLFGLAPYLPLEPAIASLRAPTSPGYGYAWFPLLAEATSRRVERRRLRSRPTRSSPGSTARRPTRDRSACSASRRAARWRSSSCAARPSGSRSR